MGKKESIKELLSKMLIPPTSKSNSWNLRLIGNALNKMDESDLTVLLLWLDDYNKYSEEKYEEVLRSGEYDKN